MSKRIRYVLIGSGLMALLLMVAAACSGDTGLAGPQGLVGPAGPKGEPGGFNAPARGEKHFYLTAFEVKGATTATELAPPSDNPKDLSGGYGFKGPGEYDSSNPDKWQVASYMWVDHIIHSSH